MRDISLVQSLSGVSSRVLPASFNRLGRDILLVFLNVLAVFHKFSEIAQLLGLGFCFLVNACKIGVRPFALSKL